MINPTVETDLVGEVVEVWERQDSPSAPNARTMLARGRVRAVTVGNGGQLLLWIEILDASGWWRGQGPDYKVGDILQVPTDTGRGDNLIRLLKNHPH